MSHFPFRANPPRLSPADELLALQKAREDAGKAVEDAKATLQAVVDNSTEPELVAQARQRLDAINSSEVQQTTPSPQEELLVPMPGGDNNQRR